MQNEAKMPGDQITAKGSMNALYIAALCHSMCIYPFMRRNFGTEGLGMPALGGLLIMLFAFGSTAEFGLGYMILAWIALLVAHRIQMYRNWAEGNVGHSQYAGDSIARVFCKSNKTARLIGEPLLCFGVGWLLRQASPILGLFVMCGGVSLIVVQTFERVSLWMRTQKLRDAQIEQRIIAAAFRGEDWEG